MSILDRIATRLGYAKAKIDYPDHKLSTARVEQFRIPNMTLTRAQLELYPRLSWVYSAVKNTSQSAAGVKLNINKMVGEETQEIINHDFERLLHRPNPKESRFEFLETTYSDLRLTGNAFWWLNSPSEGAEPAELWTIPPYKLRIVPDERMYIKAYEYDPGDGQLIYIEPWKIVHFASYHPLQEFLGLSGIEPIAVVSAGDLEMQKWNTKLFGKNNARLPGILAFADPIPDPAWEKIKAEVNTASAERQIMLLRNAGKGGVDWMQAASTMRDMEFLAGRQFTKEEIFAVLAPGLASILAINATEANAKTGKATFIEFAIWPMLSAVAGKITNSLLPNYGENLIAQYDDIRVTDKVIELEEQREYKVSHTVDEIREKYYSDKELGDDRGKMLPAQIGASPVTITDDSEEEEQPIPATGIFQPKEPEEAVVEEPEEEPEEDEVKAELKAWEKFAINRLGKKGRAFQVKHLNAETTRRIEARLKNAKRVEDIQAVFAAGWPLPSTETDRLVDALTDATRAMREQA